MEYIWMVMLAGIDIVWIISSVIEFIRAIKVLSGKCSTVLDWMDDFFIEVEDYATACVFTHLFILFLSSLAVWIYQK